ncbi:MAG: zf-HC2 domain-containing protein [Pirellulaceae bacterium]|nr:zf-HC2 domain-containing protein [Pirellulaceae bacterium]
MNDFNDELISAYLDDELSSEERAHVDAVLRERPDLRKMFTELQILGSTLQSLPHEEQVNDWTEIIHRRTKLETLMCDESGPETQQIERKTAGINRNTLLGLVGMAATVVFALLIIRPNWPWVALQTALSDSANSSVADSSEAMDRSVDPLDLTFQQGQEVKNEEIEMVIEEFGDAENTESVEDRKTAFSGPEIKRELPNKAKLLRSAAGGLSRKLPAGNAGRSDGVEEQDGAATETSQVPRNRRVRQSLPSLENKALEMPKGASEGPLRSFVGDGSTLTSEEILDLSLSQELGYVMVVRVMSKASIDVQRTVEQTLAENKISLADPVRAVVESQRVTLHAAAATSTGLQESLNRQTPNEDKTKEVEQGVTVSSESQKFLLVDALARDVVASLEAMAAAGNLSFSIEQNAELSLALVPPEHLLRPQENSPGTARAANVLGGGQDGALAKDTADATLKESQKRQPTLREKPLRKSDRDKEVTRDAKISEQTAAQANVSRRLKLEFVEEHRLSNIDNEEATDEDESAVVAAAPLRQPLPELEPTLPQMRVLFVIESQPSQNADTEGKPAKTDSQQD